MDGAPVGAGCAWAHDIYNDDYVGVCTICLLCTSRTRGWNVVFGKPVPKKHAKGGVSIMASRSLHDESAIS